MSLFPLYMEDTDMSLYKVAVVARNPKHEELATPSTDAVVDTGSE